MTIIEIKDMEKDLNKEVNDLLSELHEIYQGKNVIDIIQASFINIQHGYHMIKDDGDKKVLLKSITEWIFMESKQFKGDALNDNIR